MKMNLRVQYDDGSTADAVVSAVDLVGFEGKFNKSVAKFQQEFMLTDIYWLAWHSLHRADKSIGEFEQWLEARDPEVVFSDEDNDVVPLENSQ
jgi:hypothetical protein